MCVCVCMCVFSIHETGILSCHHVSQANRKRTNAHKIGLDSARLHCNHCLTDSSQSSKHAQGRLPLSIGQFLNRASHYQRARSSTFTLSKALLVNVGQHARLARVLYKCGLVPGLALSNEYFLTPAQIKACVFISKETYLIVFYLLFLNVTVQNFCIFFILYQNHVTYLLAEIHEDNLKELSLHFFDPYFFIQCCRLRSSSFHYF